MMHILLKIINIFLSMMCFNILLRIKKNELLCGIYSSLITGNTPHTHTYIMSVERDRCDSFELVQLDKRALIKEWLIDTANRVRTDMNLTYSYVNKEWNTSPYLQELQTEFAEFYGTVVFPGKKAPINAFKKGLLVFCFQQPIQDYIDKLFNGFRLKSSNYIRQIMSGDTCYVYEMRDNIPYDENDKTLTCIKKEFSEYYESVYGYPPTNKYLDEQLLKRAIKSSKSRYDFDEEDY